MKKNRIRRLINLDEEDGVQRTINRLNKRYNYLKAKNKNLKEESRQMKYIKFHLKKMDKLRNVKGVSRIGG
jgi:uncharacterized protein YabN with tetrapyrrole methylase and pyrophosphatase domain